MFWCYTLAAGACMLRTSLRNFQYSMSASRCAARQILNTISMGSCSTYFTFRDMFTFHQQLNLKKNDDDECVEWDTEEVHDCRAAFFRDVDGAKCT